MSIESSALVAVQGFPGLTEPEQQYLMTVAYGEGYYGQGWGSPSQLTKDESAQFGVAPLAGVGSHNWGAIQGTGPAGSFEHIDHDKNGAPYVGTFKRYNSDTEAAADVAKTLLKANVRAAVNAGDLRGAVDAQYANGYFVLSPDKYFTAVSRNYAKLTALLKWPPLLLGGAALPPLPLHKAAPWGAIIVTSALIFWGTLRSKKR